MCERGTFGFSAILIAIALLGSPAWATDSTEIIFDPDEASILSEPIEEESGGSCLGSCQNDGYDPLQCEEICIRTT